MRLRCTTLFTLACALLAAQALPAQTPAPAARNRVIGAVASLDGANASFTVKTDAGETVSVGVAADTKLLRTEPGAKTLQGAQAIEFGDIVVGDRVLAQGIFKEEEKRLLAVRVVDMSEGDIAKKRQAEAQDWQKRGVAGVVTAKDAATGLVTLRLPALMGEGELVKVAVSPKTQVKRYAPDSIKYADAKSSSLNEIAVGDQVRALGSKEEATGVVQAERVVSGSFATIAATVVSVDAAAHTLVAKNMDTGKPVTVKIIADSNLRRMPQMGGPGGMPGMGGAPGAAAPGAGAQAGAAGAPRAGGFPGGGMNGGAPGGARRGGDFSRFIEFMPKIGLDALKAGETVVIASSKGGKADEITAITLLAGADFLVQMAQMRTQQAARANGAAAGPSMGMNLDVMSMIPGQ